jgi:hypothetical protein
VAIANEIKYAHLDELILDPRNPRLGRRNLSRQLSQGEILEVIRSWDLEELAVSFLESGFWPQEALVVVRDADVDDTHLTVMEGNRRLAALKLLQAASNGEPRTRRWAEFATQLEATNLFTRVPYILAESRDDVRKFLGFRHVTGIKEWAPAEKARYIAELVDSGMSYEQVMRSIGSKTPTVRRNYISYNILRQLDDAEDVDVALVEERFSVLFLALREHGVQQFLGVDINAEPDEARQPVSGDEYLSNLEYFVRWVFGTREVPPVFSDSRFMTKFARILENEDALSYLKGSRSPSLPIAASKAGTDTDDLVDHLSSATDELELGLSTVHLYSDRDEVRRVVARLAKGFGALLNTFPEERVTICSEDRRGSE